MRRSPWRFEGIAFLDDMTGEEVLALAALAVENRVLVAAIDELRILSWFEQATAEAVHRQAGIMAALATALEPARGGA